MIDYQRPIWRWLGAAVTGIGLNFVQGLDPWWPDFPRLARRYGRAGTHAMLIPAWDFDVDGIYHSRMAVLRGVEQGFSVIRAANQGVLTVSDPYGRIVAEAGSARARVMTLSAQAPLGGLRTLDGGIGDAFGWACVAIVGLLVFWPAGQGSRLLRSTRVREERQRSPVNN